MRTYKILTVFVVSVVILILLVSLPSFSKADPTLPQRHSWEYAELKLNMFFSGDRSKPGEWGVCFWVTPKGIFQFSDIEKLYEHLSGQVLKEGARRDWLNQIGKRGWELVDYSVETYIHRGDTKTNLDSSKETMWIFKRPG